MEHLKKGVQYSHYTGSNRMEISSFVWLIKNSTNLEEIKKYADEIQKHLNELNETLAKLDFINDFK
jgi:uncharacterized coiled-coil DUF342 family protein